MKQQSTIKKYYSSQEAAFGLSHSTYSGTVEAAVPPKQRSDAEAPSDLLQEEQRLEN